MYKDDHSYVQHVHQHVFGIRNTYVEYLHPYRLNSVREDEADLQRVVAMVAGEVSMEDHPGHLAVGLHPPQLLVSDIHLLISWGDRERDTYTQRDEGERE